MQGIYNNIPETNRVSRVFNVAATLWLRFLPFPILNFSFFYVSNFHSDCFLLFLYVILAMYVAQIFF